MGKIEKITKDSAKGTAKGSSKESLKANEKTDRKLIKLEEEIRETRKKMIKLLKKQGAMKVEDYILRDTAGKDTRLSEMFGDKENLILVHNMGKSCSYCTLWADGFSGTEYFIRKKAAFAVVSPDTPEVQKEFSESRGWKFKMYSASESEFISDMGYYTKKDGYWPGVSVFHKHKSGKISRVAKDYFGPGDFYSSPWHFFDLLPKGAKEMKENK